MRRSPAVGVVTCNRKSMLFSHLSSSITPHLSTDGPRRTQPDTHTLRFWVTTAYITHTCSTVRSPSHAHATRTYMSFVLQFFLRSRSAYLSISRSSPPFSYIIASHFPSPSSFSSCNTFSLSPVLSLSLITLVL